MEVVPAIGLAVAVAAGLIIAGGAGRWLEVLVLGAGVTIALLAGWPASGSAALGCAAAFLVLEAVFGRLDNDHVPGILVLTTGILGSVLAAGFARGPSPLPDDAGPIALPAGTPWLHESPGRGRLPAGTLEYEIERARRHERQFSVLAIVPDQLDDLAAGAGDSLPGVLDTIDAAIEDAVRAIDVVERLTQARFRICLPETGPDLARAVGERIRLRMDSTRPELEDGRVVDVSVSIGISSYPADGVSEVELEAGAERALARAQELGGNRTLLFSVPAGAPRGWGLTSAADTTPPPPPR